MRFVKRHWPAFFAVAANLPSMWRGLVWLFDWEERIETAVAKFHAYGDLAGVIRFFLNPPPWLIWITLPAGLLLIWWDIKRKPASRNGLPAASVATTPGELLPDISARDPYFRILEGSLWKQEQLRTTTDTSNLRRDWLEFRLRTEIHKALRNAHLAAWGEECLHGMVTTPEKPIPPQAWDRIELVFDNNPNLPRTAAYFKGPTTFQKGQMASVGVKFNEAQFFNLFPIGPKSQTTNWRPIHQAIAHVAQRIGDTEDQKVWPETRRQLRQAAYDKKLKMRGRKQLVNRRMTRDGDYADIYTDIDNDYWSKTEINALATSSQHQTDYHTDPETAYAWGPKGTDERNRYAQLLVDWDDILRLWP